MTEEELINLVKMTYNDSGKQIRIQNDIIGIVDNEGLIRFINTSNSKILEEKYSLGYICEKVIILRRYNPTRSAIINRNTFEILYETDKFLKVTGDIIYESDIALISSKTRKIFNLLGEEIYSINSETIHDLQINQTDNEEYYIVDERDIFDDYTYINEVTNKNKISIFKYDKENNRFESKWSSTKYEIKNVGYGLYSFSEIHNYSNSIIYDIINLRKI